MEFFMDQGDQPIERAGVTLTPGEEQSCHIALVVDRHDSF
jgi:hypothetical protein